MLALFSSTNAIYCCFCLVQIRDIRTSRKCNNNLIVIGQNTSNLLMYKILVCNWLLIFTIWLSWLSPISINNAISYRYIEMIEELFPNSFFPMCIKSMLNSWTRSLLFLIVIKPWAVTKSHIYHNRRYCLIQIDPFSIRQLP